MMVSNFDHAILAVWASYFHCDLTDFDQPGTTLFEWEEQHDSNWLYLWHIGQRSFIRFGPQFRRQVEGLLAQSLANTALGASDVIAHWGRNKAALKYVVDLCYLQSHNFSPAQFGADYKIRQLSEEDRPALETMQRNCTQDDLEEGDVDVAHEVACGCWRDEKLVALSSMYTFRGGFADIGVLTHPSFRKLGLGKAAVSAVCAWLLANGKLPLYRYELNNLASAGIAQSLGFVRYFQQESVLLSNG